MNRYETHEYAEIGAFVVYGIIATIVIPLFVGFSMGGFSESFVSGRPVQFGDFLLSYLIYYIFIVGALLGIPILKLREMILTKRGEHPANQKKPEMFNVAIIHDPVQDGALYHAFENAGFKKNPMRWSINPIRLILGSFIFFSIVGIFQSVYSLSFVGIPQQAFQQVTKVGSIVFSVEPPAFAETLLILFIFYCLLSVVGYFTSKWKLGKGAYYFGGVLMSILTSVGWMGLHKLIYGSSESALLYTGIFGFAGCILTLLFGSFVIFYIFHITNNLFIALGEVYSAVSEDIYLIAGLSLFLLTIAWIGTEISLYKRKKQNQEKIIVPK